MHIEIRKLSIEDGEDIYQMLQHIPADENGFINSVNGKTFEEYKEWLAGSVKNSLQEGIVDGWKVPETVYWLFEAGKPAGYGKIRHFLTEQLLNNGGNIGYSIVPSARNRGLGKVFLRHLIEESKGIGMKQLLLTVREQNKASIAVAMANHGVIEKIESGRYYIWIYLDRNEESMES